MNINSLGQNKNKNNSLHLSYPKEDLIFRNVVTLDIH